MNHLALGRCLVAFMALFAFSMPAHAQTFPTKPITLVVPAPPGGVVDATGRLLGEAMSRQLGQPVVIDNRGGASGNIGYSHVATHRYFPNQAGPRATLYPSPWLPWRPT